MSDPNNEFGNANPTHINAYYADLEAAKEQLLIAKGKVSAAEQAVLDNGGTIPEDASEAEDDNAPLAKPAKAKKAKPAEPAESVAASAENDTAEPAEEPPVADAQPEAPAEDASEPVSETAAEAPAEPAPTA